MNLPNVIKDLVKAQNSLDSAAYSNCFSETANVIDEGKTYQGRSEIKAWIEKANQEVAPVMKPIDYQEISSGNVLHAEISGNFDGSPLVLKYHHLFEDGLIQTLQITG
jgi:hypothetical protein